MSVCFFFGWRAEVWFHHTEDYRECKATSAFIVRGVATPNPVRANWIKNHETVTGISPKSCEHIRWCISFPGNPSGTDPTQTPGQRPAINPKTRVSISRLESGDPQMRSKTTLASNSIPVLSMPRLIAGRNPSRITQDSATMIVASRSLPSEATSPVGVFVSDYSARPLLLCLGCPQRGRRY